MRRFHLGLLTATFPVLMLSLILTGCGKKNDDDEFDTPAKKRAPGQKAAQAALLKPVKATIYNGVIRGKINWVGDKPNLEKMTSDLQAGIKTDRDYCLSGKDYEKSEQEYRFGKNGKLGNVFVWIEPEKDHYFDIPADQLAKFKGTTVNIHQPHCAFLPHAIVLFPSYYKDGKQVPSGQKLVVENDATVSHNSSVKGGLQNPERNQTLAPQTEKDFTLKPENSPITIGCGVHTWMKAYIRAFDHPYAAVSSVGADLPKKVFENDASDKFGTYEIAGVPVGAKVRIVAWHESVGFLGDRQGRELTVKTENVEDFDAKAK